MGPLLHPNLPSPPATIPCRAKSGGVGKKGTKSSSPAMTPTEENTGRERSGPVGPSVGSLGCIPPSQTAAAASLLAGDSAAGDSLGTRAQGYRATAALPPDPTVEEEEDLPLPVVRAIKRSLQKEILALYQKGGPLTATMGHSLSHSLDSSSSPSSSSSSSPQPSAERPKQKTTTSWELVAPADA